MTIMKRSMRKAAQKKQLKIERIKNAVKLVSSMLAAGFFMSGFGLGSRMIRRAEAEGSNIKFDGADGALSAANNVFDIYAQQVNGTVATNRFENFTLAGGQIANMYFKKDATVKNDDYLKTYDLSSKIKVDTTDISYSIDEDLDSKLSESKTYEIANNNYYVKYSIHFIF